jgi:uncharacterized protein YeaO (DUF488 family)
MAIRIVELGSPRLPGEGLRIGTVRRPPRGIPKAEFASRNYYDVWFPNLAPSEMLLEGGQSALAASDGRAWRQFVRRFRLEMKEPNRRREIDLLAALSRRTNFSVGCYCVDETRCHRSVLRDLLSDAGALLAAR